MLLELTSQPLLVYFVRRPVAMVENFLEECLTNTPVEFRLIKKLYIYNSNLLRLFFGIVNWNVKVSDMNYIYVPTKIKLKKLNYMKLKHKKMKQNKPTNFINCKYQKGKTLFHISTPFDPREERIFNNRKEKHLLKIMHQTAGYEHCNQQTTQHLNGSTLEVCT